MTTFTPELETKAHCKKQRFRCPNCAKENSLEEIINCSRCGATFRTQIKQVAEPESVTYE